MTCQRSCYCNLNMLSGASCKIGKISCKTKSVAVKTNNKNFNIQIPSLIGAYKMLVGDTDFMYEKIN